MKTTLPSTSQISSDAGVKDHHLAIANEAWVPQPEFAGESQTTNSFALTFGTAPGYQYTVRYRDSLAATNTWNALLTTNGTGKLTTVTVSDPVPGHQRFYRLERKPALWERKTRFNPCPSLK